MSDSKFNIHRSFGGLLVGNVVAIFLSSVVCLVAWQLLFPDFYRELRNHLDQKKEKPTTNQQPEGSSKKTTVEKSPTSNEPVGQVPTSKKPEPRPNNQGDKPGTPDFHFGVWTVTLVIDLFFSAFAGYLCVRIAACAMNNHGMLMALLIIVWKFQQLVGFVENQLPTTLLVAELIGLPIACIFGSMLADDPARDQLTEAEVDEAMLESSPE